MFFKLKDINTRDGLTVIDYCCFGIGIGSKNIIICLIKKFIGSNWSSISFLEIVKQSK